MLMLLALARLQELLEGHTTDHTGNTVVTVSTPLLCASSREVNLDEVQYDPVYRKRISKYMGQNYKMR